MTRNEMRLIIELIDMKAKEAHMIAKGHRKNREDEDDKESSAYDVGFFDGQHGAYAEIARMLRELQEVTK